MAALAARRRKVRRFMLGKVAMTGAERTRLYRERQPKPVTKDERIRELEIELARERARIRELENELEGQPGRKRKRKRRQDGRQSP
jgi:hypothetical protein